MLRNIIVDLFYNLQKKFQFITHTFDMLLPVLFCDDKIKIAQIDHSEAIAVRGSNGFIRQIIAPFNVKLLPLFLGSIAVWVKIL